MSQVTEKGPKSPQMNMTPMIDVTFQLIIFFMLVNTITSTEDVEMIVPKLWEPEIKEIKDVEKVVINVKLKPTDPDAKRDGEEAWMYGHTVEFVRIGLDTYAPEDLARMTKDLKEVKEGRKKIQVILRADGALHYGELQPILQHITQAGIELINIVAYMPDGGPDNAPHL